MTPIRALLAPLAAAASLAGCSGGDDRLTKQEYEQQVRSIYGEVQQAFLRTNVGAPEELAGRVEDAQRSLRDAAEQLERLESPEEVEHENEEIVEGLREYAEDLDELREAAERGDRSAIDAFNDAIGRNEAVERIAEAAEEMKFKGYDLGPISEE